LFHALSDRTSVPSRSNIAHSTPSNSPPAGSNALHVLIHIAPLKRLPLKFITLHRICQHASAAHHGLELYVLIKYNNCIFKMRGGKNVNLDDSVKYLKGVGPKG